MAATDFVAPALTGEREKGGLPGLLGENDDKELYLYIISSPGTEMTAKEKYAERMKKLRDLHGKRNEARKLNHQEVRLVVVGKFGDNPSSCCYSQVRLALSLDMFSDKPSRSVP